MKSKGGVMGEIVSCQQGEDGASTSTDHGSLLHPDGLKLFRGALGLDLRAITLTTEEVTDLAESTLKEVTHLRPRNYNPLDRLTQIALLGYHEASQQLGESNSALYQWVWRVIPKRYAAIDEPKHQLQSGSGRSMSASQPERRQQPVVDRRPRPVGARAVRRSVLIDNDASRILEWQDRALCAQTDPEAFHPEKGGSTREAKKVCMSCDVRSECLEYALSNGEHFGIWGGLSERERRRLKSRAL